MAIHEWGPCDFDNLYNAEYIDVIIMVSTLRLDDDDVEWYWQFIFASYKVWCLHNGALRRSIEYNDDDSNVFRFRLILYSMTFSNKNIRS